MNAVIQNLLNKARIHIDDFELGQQPASITSALFFLKRVNHIGLDGNHQKWCYHEYVNISVSLDKVDCIHCGKKEE